MYKAIFTTVKADVDLPDFKGEYYLEPLCTVEYTLRRRYSVSNSNKF